ncbi:MAG: multidrug DMT transporter permease [Chlorobiaceae bacterium]|jgi:drug/metabolite transporter (DMT)-like permease|nr:multidrug DMT transporter permease [Chlorobiaceae bacterium]
MMKSERSLIIGGFILISIIWGSTWFAIKIGLASISPFYGILFRFMIAAAILAVLMKLRGEKLSFDKKSIVQYLNLAVLSFSFPFALVYWGEQYIASGLASVLFGAYPFVVAFGSHLYLPAERLNIFKSIGIVIGFFGIIIIFWSDLHLGSANVLGMSAILVSTLMQGSSLVILKKINHPMSPTALSLGGMLFGLLIMIPLAIIFEDISYLKFDASGVGSILYLSTFGTVVTFVTYYWLMKRVEVVYLSLVSFVTPILAVALGSILLNEILSAQMFLGAGLVLLGILTANGGDLKEQVKKMLDRKRNNGK